MNFGAEPSAANRERWRRRCRRRDHRLIDVIAPTVMIAAGVDAEIGA
ncbi:hypothetical protein [Siculibacillus lacustris]|nr:hypothetical protein [Siculibacillus lacustris]